MSNLSGRAFEEAQKRKLYPQRNGALGVACIQRDLLLATKHISQASEHLWLREKTNIDSPSNSGETNIHRLQSNKFQEEMAMSFYILLRISGSLGIDLVSLGKAEVEKQELTII